MILWPLYTPHAHQSVEASLLLRHINEDGKKGEDGEGDNDGEVGDGNGHRSRVRRLGGGQE